MLKTDFNFYTKLKDDGVVSQSDIPKSIIRSHDFDSLLRSKTIVKVKSGRGFKYEVKDLETLVKFYVNKYPSGDIDIENEVDNQLKYRNTKVSKIEKETIMFIRGVVEIELNGQQITNLPQHIARFGIFGSVLKSLKAKKICYVENMECFLNAEKIISDEYLFVHFYGRLPKADKLKMIQCEHFLHWGDYDFVGLNEYLRAKESFESVSTFVPNNFDEVFNKYSIPRKAKDSIYKNVKNSTDLDVVKIRKMIIDSGNFLEQQIFLEGKL